jgi:proteasome component ECM29
LIWPVLEKALAGKTWDGKETVLYAFAKFVENTKHIWSAEDANARTFVKVSSITCMHAHEPHVVPLSHNAEVWMWR